MKRLLIGCVHAAIFKASCRPEALVKLPEALVKLPETLVKLS